MDRWIRAFVKYNASVQRPAAERSDRFRAIRKRKMDRGRHGVLRLAIVFIAGGFSLGVASAVKGTGPLRAAGSESFRARLFGLPKAVAFCGDCQQRSTSRYNYTLLTYR